MRRNHSLMRTAIRSFFTHRLLVAVVGIAWAGVTLAPAQTTWYVDDDAPGDPGPGDPSVSDPLEDGSAEHPFDAIQEGIDAAIDGDTVLVLNGTYTGDGNRDLDFGGRLITVRSESGPDTCIIDCEHAGRGFHFHSGESMDAVVDGLTITNGDTGGVLCSYSGCNPIIRNCTITGNGGYHGGGVCGAATISNCTITANRANYGGGGVACGSGTTIADCTISGNTAEAEGGGISAAEVDLVTIIGCTVSGNTAGEWGGGVHGPATIIGCTVAGNTAERDGGGICGAETIIDCTISGNTAGEGGGGVSAAGSIVTITGCTVTENLAMSYGGGGVSCGGGVVAVTDCTIDSNRADYGGGMACYPGSVTITNCTISGNTATHSGGGVIIEDCDATITDCMITGNGATYSLFSEGGGLACSRGAVALSNCTIMGNTAEIGGGVHCFENDPAITNCTVAANTAKVGGGVCCEGGAATIANCVIVANVATPSHEYRGAGGGVWCYGSTTITNCTIAANIATAALEDQGGGGVCCLGTPTITNCILWANQAPRGPAIILLGWPDTSTLTVSYSDIQGGEAAIHVAEDCALDWGDGNIDAEPLLTYDRVHLQAGSPCRCAGDPAGEYSGQTDIDGEPRVGDGRADMGADEFIDSDGNGLPDWWEQFYFGSPTGADPAADGDGDGLSNLEEYVLSRNPTLPPTTYYVDVAGDDAWDGLTPVWDGQHGPKATVHAAIDVTERSEGDRIIIADGTYTGPGNRNLHLDGKVIAVRSANGPEACVIDCEHSGRGFCFLSRETADTVVAGLTIANGYVSDMNGGGVYCRHSGPTVMDCVITGNVAEEAYTRGGGVYCVQSSLTLANCAITGNTAGGGGGAHFTDSNPTVLNCTIAGNTAHNRGGGLSIVRGSNARIANAILSANQAPVGPEINVQGSANPSTLTISYSAVEGGQAEMFVNADCTLNWGPGNIDADPLFVDPDGPDDDPNTWEDNDYRLGASSPCIDAGCNCAVPPDVLDLDGDGDMAEYTPFDLDGEGRFFDDPATEDSGSGLPPIVDMGAYEFGGSDTPPCRGDLDGDRDVDWDDLMVLLDNYGTPEGAGGVDGDMDCDGDIELSDLAALLAVYGTTCE